MKKYSNKKLVITTEQNEEFERSNICWICGKLIDVGDNKVLDHCHITGFYRGSTHYSYNLNLKISKKLPVIFHNLRGYDRHLIFREMSKFNFSVSIIRKGLENYMNFTLNNNIVFIDSMLFLNSSLDKLIKKLSNENFKYLSAELSDLELELVKQKGVYPFKYMNSFKKFKESKLPNIDIFLNSLKNCGVSKK